MTGRKPIPANLINADNHKKSKEEIERRRKIEEGLKSTSTLRVPSYLSDEAKKEWRRLIKLYRLMDADILSDLDANALTIYCEAFAIYKKAHEVWVQTQKVVSRDEEAQKILDKTFNIMEKQSRIMAKFSEQLCLTPVGRARMGMAKKDEPSALEKMLMDDDEE